MSDTQQLKDLHDHLLAQRPEGAKHDEDSCALCAMGEPGNQSTNPGGSMPESFTQDDVDGAVAAATADLKKRLSELEAQVQESEVGKAVAEATSAKDAAVSELQSKLDAAEAARTAAENKLAETEQYWSDAIAASEEEAAFAARREQRVAAAKEAGVFGDDYVTENADRFAAMAEEDFAARLQEWQLIAGQASKATPGKPKIPAVTALRAARAERAQPSSALGFISEMRVKRQDPRVMGGV